MWWRKPAKSFTDILAVLFEADLCWICLSKGLTRVPAKLIVLTLNIFVALLIDGLLLCTRCIKWPVFFHPTVKTVVTVLVRVATLVLLSTKAHLLFTIA